MSEADLGQRVSSHKGSLGAGGWLWYVGALCILSSAFWAFNGLKSLALGGEGNPIEQMGTGLCSLVMGVLLLLFPVRRLMQKIHIHERGFVHVGLFGSKTVRREDVAQVHRTVHRRRHSSTDEIAVSLRNGTIFRMFGLSDGEQIATMLRSWVGGAAPAPSPAGWSPPGGAPPAGGGWSPPGGGGGWSPPGGGGPPASGGWSPPS